MKESVAIVYVTALRMESLTLVRPAIKFSTYGSPRLRENAKVSHEVVYHHNPTPH